MIKALPWFLFATTALANPPVPLEEDCDQNPCTKYSQTLVWADTGVQRQIRWTEHPGDVATMDLEYNLRVFEFPPRTPQVPILTVTAPEGTTSVPWTPSRGGHFYVEINACNLDRPEGDPNRCSVWANSLDAQYTDSQKYPRGFIWYFQLAAPTGGGLQ